MERGVVTERNYILRYLGSFWREGERYLMFEPVVTLEMAERMRREAESESNSGGASKRGERRGEVPKLR